jgi:hypothetical protein
MYRKGVITEQNEGLQKEKKLKMAGPACSEGKLLDVEGNRNLASGR